MTGYLIRRLGTAVIVVLGVTFLTFAMLHIIAPSPALQVLGVKAPPQAVAIWNKQNGFDDPFLQQFWNYCWALLHGNLGYSYKLNQSVTALFAEKAPLSGFLSASSLVLAILIAIPLGIYQGVKRNSIGDMTITTVAFILYSMPTFLLGLILVQIFALNFNWVHPTVSQDQSLTGALSDFKDLILPIVTLTLTVVAGYSRYQRSAAIDTLTQDYIKVARAKGLSERLVLSRHLLRNASLPMITLIGLSLPALIAGNLLIEYVYNISGLGLLFINSLQQEDYNVLLAYTLLGAIFTVVGNLIADVLLTVSDPRIRIA